MGAARRHHRSARRQRFNQCVGAAFEAGRQHKAIGRRNFSQRVGCVTGEVDAIGDAQCAGQINQSRLERAFTKNDQTHTAVRQRGERSDQGVETFLRRQASDGDDYWAGLFPQPLMAGPRRCLLAKVVVEHRVVGSGHVLMPRNGGFDQIQRDTARDADHRVGYQPIQQRSQQISDAHHESGVDVFVMGKGIAFADVQTCERAGQCSRSDRHDVNVSEGRQLCIKAIAPKKSRECRHRTHAARAVQFNFFHARVEVRDIYAAAGEHQQRHVVTGVDQRTGQSRHHFLGTAGAEVVQDNQQFFHWFHTW